MLPLLALGVPATAAPSCLETAGEDRAKAYVEQCIEVSPATHPPCNVVNPCELIIDEIKRGCAILVKAGDDVPPFCKPELPPGRRDETPGANDDEDNPEAH
jgi:hypothetical protein